MGAYIALIIGGLFFLFGFAILLIILDAKRKSKIRSFSIYAKDGIENNFTSNHTYGFCSAKGIRITKSKNGKFRIQSQSRLVNPSYFK
ncbi:MAG: hypothetical protein DSY46_05285 [Hydrogenimonas sp.]|nr:MAG: hypothetical protein DSY46_05285 [Hydrogenimonas sp.]